MTNQPTPPAPPEAPTTAPAADTPKTVERAAAILSDPRASCFLLEDTINTLITQHSIQRAYVDLTTLAGLTTAAVLLQAGIAYEHLDFGQPCPREADTLIEALVQDPHAYEFRPSCPRTLEDFAYLKHKSAGTHTIDLDAIATVDANLVLIPAMTAEGYIDFSLDCLMGLALKEIEMRNRDVLIIAPPERGLRPVFADVNPQAPTQSVPIPAAPVGYERLALLVSNSITEPQDAASTEQ